MFLRTIKRVKLIQHQYQSLICDSKRLFPIYTNDGKRNIKQSQNDEEFKSYPEPYQKYAKFTKAHPLRTFMSNNPFQTIGSVFWQNLILPLLIVYGLLGSILLCAKMYRYTHPLPKKSETEIQEIRSEPLLSVICDCGEQMLLKQAKQCYDDDSNFNVCCDVCDETIHRTNELYHCGNKIHGDGYDLCMSCAAKQ